MASGAPSIKKTMWLMRMYWHMPRTELLILETSGPRLISHSLILSASARTSHPLVCMGHFDPSDVSNPPPTYREHLLGPTQHDHHGTGDVALASAELLVILVMECFKSLPKVTSYSWWHSNVHGQGDHHKPYAEPAQKEPGCWQLFSSPAVPCTA